MEPSSYQVLFAAGDGTYGLVQAPNSELKIRGNNGLGSTNTYIRRMLTTDIDVGDGFTYADSATDGMSVTIDRDGWYAISYTDARSSGTAAHGISINSIQLTNGCTVHRPNDRSRVRFCGSCIINKCIGD